MTVLLFQTTPELFSWFYHHNAFQFSGSVYPAPPISRSWLKWRSNVARDWEAINEAQVAKKVLSVINI
ncbi:hypothetical protein KEM48_013723 [Puccinia striiformis f. sp. tritici PST-130]|nr:hypothetical protein H4Q26_015079 [Puccinia striiformis f. sp. tritici PST-130]KAI9630695.1 hypothetical protein KEM48_013723 [Puccinia striiformis f. sp. tritici PST-130]